MSSSRKKINYHLQLLTASYPTETANIRQRIIEMDAAAAQYHNVRTEVMKFFGKPNLEDNSRWVEPILESISMIFDVEHPLTTNELNKTSKYIENVRDKYNWEERRMKDERNNSILQQSGYKEIYSELSEILLKETNEIESINRAIRQYATETLPSYLKMQSQLKTGQDYLQYQKLTMEENERANKANLLAKTAEFEQRKVSIQQQTQRDIQKIENDPYVKSLFNKNTNKISLLYDRVEEMRRYGQVLKVEDANKGELAENLAIRLKNELDIFFGPQNQGRIKKLNNFIELTNFQAQFNKTLHDPKIDKEMATHRKYWKVIVANIAIALTIVGAALLLGKFAYSKYTHTPFTLFFDKTNRQKIANRIDSALARLAPSLT